MMKMKRIVAWILCFCILAVFTACEKKQTNSVSLDSCLPFELKFGDSYDEFSKKIQSSFPNVPQLQNADSNNGYLTEDVYFNSTDIKSYLGYTVTSDLPIDSGSFCFSFNQNKELYEWYWFNQTANRGWDSVINDMIQVYNKMFGFDGRVNDDPEVCAIWNTDTIQANIRRFQTKSGTEFAVLVFHNFEYDLNS